MDDDSGFEVVEPESVRERALCAQVAFATQRACGKGNNAHHKYVIFAYYVGVGFCAGWLISYIANRC